MSSSTMIDSRKKDKLILRNGPMHGLEHTHSVEKFTRLILQKKQKFLFKFAL